MTPFEINLLLHIYTSPSPPDNYDLPLTKTTLASFMEEGMISTSESEGNTYEITDRGEAHVKQLCNLAWPVSAWIDENGNVI